MPLNFFPYIGRLYRISIVCSAWALFASVSAKEWFIEYYNAFSRCEPYTNKLGFVINGELKGTTRSIVVLLHICSLFWSFCYSKVTVDITTKNTNLITIKPLLEFFLFRYIVSCDFIFNFTKHLRHQFYLSILLYANTNVFPIKI